MERRSFLKNASLLSLAAFMPGISWANRGEFDLTFIVTADLHFDVPPERHEFLHVQSINKVDGYFQWPEYLDGKKTNFKGVGDMVSGIKGVVLAGDITDKAHPLALDFLKMRYEKGPREKQIKYDCYVGLGNHDLHPLNPLVDGEDEKRRNMMLEYVDARHKGRNAPVPVTSFDPLSRNYSWEWGGVHFIQGQLYPGNKTFGQVSSLEWLEDDLDRHASNGKPVVIFQHYGFYDWGIDEFDKTQLEKFYQIISRYNIIGIFTGHNHIAVNVNWRGIDTFQVNNAWHESDGEASFTIVRLTNKFMDVVTCKRTVEDRKLYLTGPFFSRKF